jgi:diguanylate cyclase (GGDEF)-like protein
MVTEEVATALGGKRTGSFFRQGAAIGLDGPAYALTLPLVEDNRVIGALDVSAADPTLFAGIDDDLHQLYGRLVIGLVVLWASLFPILWQLSSRLQRQAAENERLALHDSLTGLANRSLLGDRLANAIARNERRAGLVALMVIDLDGFKDVNDTYGHHAGDQLLQHVARVLQRTVRPEDTVARLGGDEFAIVTGDIEAVEGADAVARRVAQAFATPIVIDGRSMRAKASIGLALAPTHGRTGDDLLRRADLAMYHAKEHGHAVVRYTPALDMRRTRRHPEDGPSVVDAAAAPAT